MSGPLTTEIKITLPYWLMWCLIFTIAFQTVSNLLLVKQRYESDMAFLKKVKEIQADNAKLRAELGRQ